MWYTRGCRDFSSLCTGTGTTFFVQEVSSESSDAIDRRDSGKYALDKGLELGKEVGPQALETAAMMLKMVLDRIAKKRPETAAEFPGHPQTYEKPLQQALEAELLDQAFAAKLSELLARYERAATLHAASSGVSYHAELRGGGAVAQGPAAAAAGEDGVAVSGDVHGGIHMGHTAREER